MVRCKHIVSNNNPLVITHATMFYLAVGVSPLSIQIEFVTLVFENSYRYYIFVVEGFLISIEFVIKIESRAMKSLHSPNVISLLASL